MPAAQAIRSNGQTAAHFLYYPYRLGLGSASSQAEYPKLVL